jgi:transglutaminase-like putative cysteine protease
MNERSAYLAVDEVIDWQTPEILALAQQLAVGRAGDWMAIAQACFEWVRDEIRHSADYRQNPVTWKASEVLRYGTGYCYAKSHLLAALLRAQGIPAGFSYQRLSVNDDGPPYCLHGLNGVYLPRYGWYRVDPRGNRRDIQTRFTPPQGQLAYGAQLPGEVDFPSILVRPLPVVVQALQAHQTWDDMGRHLPDVSPEQAEQWGLMGRPAERSPLA